MKNMKLRSQHAEVYIPEGVSYSIPLSTSHLGIGAHQDDLEIMAYHGILSCFYDPDPDSGFFGVIVTDGSGSPRTGPYASYSNEEMMRTRIKEQKKAASIGNYLGVALLNYPSASVKEKNPDVVEDLKEVIGSTCPDVVYTHALTDRHDTHVAIALRTVEALRSLPEGHVPTEFFGCEVWGSLDWLTPGDKRSLDVSGSENLGAALLGVFDSQISGGKRYDLATLGRRRANATYAESHQTDESSSLIFAMDLRPLIENRELDPVAYALEHVDRFKEDMHARLKKFA